MVREVRLSRYSDGGESTLGLIFVEQIWRSYSLEDTHRDVKIYAQTRIPEGCYQLKLNTEVAMNSQYAQRFPDIHKGMIEVTNIPNYTYVLMHEGNWDTDTAGCILIGNTANNNKLAQGFIGDCDPAYRSVYSEIAGYISSGDEVWLTVESLEPIQHK